MGQLTLFQKVWKILLSDKILEFLFESLRFGKIIPLKRNSYFKVSFPQCSVSVRKNQSVESINQSAATNPYLNCRSIRKHGFEIWIDFYALPRRGKLKFKVDQKLPLKVSLHMDFYIKKSMVYISTF